MPSLYLPPLPIRVYSIVTGNDLFYCLFSVIAILKQQIEKINNPLFKAMKSEIRDELFMIHEDDDRKLTNKELKEMQTGLKLNKDTSNVDMDEDTDDDDY